MKWKFSRPAFAGGAAVLATLALTGLTPLPAKADITYTASWVDSSAGKCLGVYAANMTNGTPIVQWTCDGTPNQKWEIQTTNGAPGGPIWTEIRNSQDPSKCLGVLASATGDGSNLVIWDCNGNRDQLWFFQPLDPRFAGSPISCYNIVNFNASPKVLGILGGSFADGAQAVIWDNLSMPVTAHPDQIWCPKP